MDRRSFIVGSAALVWLPGCVSKPTMQLKYAQVQSAGLMGIGMNIVMSVHNANKFDVQIRNVRVRTTIQDRWALPPLAYSPNIWLRAKHTTPVNAPVIIPWQLVPPLLGATASSPSIRYHVEGEADVTATSSLNIKSDNYPVDEEGTIPRAALLAAARVNFPYLQ